MKIEDFNRRTVSVTAYDGTSSKTTTYNYSDHINGDKANLVNSVAFPTGTISYDYDGFYRASYDVEVGGSDILTTDYTFVNGTEANSTSLVVASITNTGNNWSNTLSYTYDDNGNIVTISEGNTLKATYTYDGLNQLVREDNVWLGKTIAYTYDKGGNIQLVEEYTLASGALDGLTATDSYTYLYGDSNWRDKLTSYDGNSITYDAIGNRTGYNGYTYSWQAGRELAAIIGTNLSANYKYDSSGVRTQKTVNGVTTSYTLEGSNVIKETNGTDTLWYYYNANGSVSSFELNGTAYFYVKDYQDNIVAITDANGNKVVKYLYDSWGKLISITGSLASTVGVINPYRYRGYRYDSETGLYYLQSRYYDPEMKRFINADDATMLDGANAHLLENNLFAYCMNNPIMLSDDGGNWPSWATKLLIGTAVIAAAVVLTVATAGTGTALACFAVGALKGAVVGAAIGAASGGATGAISHRIKTGSWKGAGKAALEGAADGYMSGAISGFIMGGVTSSACFVAGTAVLTAAGYVAIENIVTGDYVWAENPDTGEKALKRVAQTFVSETDELVHVYVDGEEIVCTPEHPFYVPSRGWTGATHLRAGDILLLVNGQYVVVEQIQHELLEATVKVYNFEVEDFHTDFVGEQSVLVHNLCKKPGSYEITTSNNRVYVGKGSEARMAQSARRLIKKGFTVTSKVWQSARSNQVAYIDEYMKMAKYGFDFGGKLINKIMSPGAKLFELML